jgi:hypothetical protein
VADVITKEFDLGKKSGSVKCHVSADRKRVVLELAVSGEGVTKSGLNGLIDALKAVREKMDR